MHQRLSQLLGHEVVGEVVRVGDAFFDVAHGRICLDRLSAEGAYALVEQLRRAFGSQLLVDDQLHLRDREQMRRGWLEVSIPVPDTGTLYLLQITSHYVVAFFERRFWICTQLPTDVPAQADVMARADLMGSYNEGLLQIVQQGETPLRLLGELDPLFERYIEAQAVVVRAAERGAVGAGPAALAATAAENAPAPGVALGVGWRPAQDIRRRLDLGAPAEDLGASAEVEAGAKLERTPEISVEALVGLLPALRRAFRLVPWSLHRGRPPLAEHSRERLCPHEPALEGTVMFALDQLRGEPDYRYEHDPVPFERYEQASQWLADLHQSLCDSFAPPQGVAAMARASSVDSFLRHFPGYQPLVDTTFEEKE